MDNYTENILKRMDKEIKKKFKLSFVDLLNDPSAYLSQEGISRKLSNMAEYADSQIEKMLEVAKGGSREQENATAKADDLTKRMGSYIRVHARQNSIPIVKPSESEIRVTDKDKLYFTEMDADLSNLIERLIESSKFVVDITESQGGFSAGRWLFSGEKECILGVHAPRNSISMLRQSRAEIARMVKEASDSIKGL